MTLRERVEARLVAGVFRLLGALRPIAAARLAGGIARAIGPFLPVSEVARINLRLAMPKLDRKGERRLLRKIWWNLGCTVGELPHLSSLREQRSAPGYEMEGEEVLRRIAAGSRPAIFFSGHLGNWELLGPSAAEYGVRLALLYRAADNPAVDRMIAHFRRLAIGGETMLLPKGAQGARGAVAHLRAGGILGILIDQKLNDGIAVELFGQPAMTAPGMAALALKFRCPVIPVHVERLGPAHLKVIVEPPLEIVESGDRQRDIATLTRAANASLERWIRARPDGWLWLHRRYDKALYRRRRMQPGQGLRP